MKKLELILKKEKRSATWLAGETGKSAATVLRYVGDTKSPTIKWVIKAAEVLRVEVKDIID